MSIHRHYEEDDDEDGRLGGLSLEWLRSVELIGRVLPAAPARIADVAGGPGRYAAWLAGLGHAVSLLDLTPRHVEQARRRAVSAGVTLEAVVGDARALPWPEESFDVVLEMGALYHLPERADRLACLAEARRVLKPGGALVTSHIGRWASLLDGYARGFIAEEAFRALVDADLATGRHANPSRHPGWFTTAYFHTPAEIATEVTEAGFVDVRVLAVEGFAGFMNLTADQVTGDRLDTLLGYLRQTEAEPALLGASPHLLSLSRKAA